MKRGRMEGKLLEALKYISLISVFHHDSLETLKLYSGIIDLYSKVKAIAKHTWKVGLLLLVLCGLK